ncbi:MAG TPA: FAD-dependent monooxygenase [Nocardioidaceae bacterium]|nr:FAD-dependent monooxygenase [Nocardioidaceae bacterium]
MTRTAVVVGGGIGGLTAAVSLVSHGWRVTVLEQAPEFTEVGAGLTLWSNALAALDAIGVGDAVRATGSISGPAGTRIPDGGWLTRIPAGQLEEEFGVTAVGIHRAVLVDLLRAALPEEALVAGAEVVDVYPDVPVSVAYRSGGHHHEVRGDLVVAADGINSRTRRQLWKNPGRVRYTGITAWRAVTPEPWPEELVSGISWGRGEEFGAVELGDGRVYWFGAVNAPAGRWSDDEMAEVRRIFGHWHDPIPRLLDATPAGSVLRSDLFHLRPGPDTYVHRRVALLGDAAHAMTPHLGQGACQAIEDAVVLGDLLDEGDVDEALAEYDRVRRPRTREVARMSRLSGRLGQQLTNPLAVSVRNRLLKVAPPKTAMGQLARYATWRP